MRAASRFGIQVTEAREGFPPELPIDHPLVRLCVEEVGKPAGTAPYGTDASELQAIAPCVVLGPGDIAEAHTPTEKVRVAELVAVVPILTRLATCLADSLMIGSAFVVVITCKAHPWRATSRCVDRYA